MALLNQILGAEGARRIERLLTYVALIAAFAIVLGIVLARADSKPDVIRIGFQKSSTLITSSRREASSKRAWKSSASRCSGASSPAACHCSRP